MFVDAGEEQDAPVVGAPRVVEVPEDVYHGLQEEALASGTTPAEWIAAHLSQPATAVQPECEGQPPSTLVDGWAGYIGRFSSGCGDLSERVSEIYAEGMMEKHQARQRQL
jgi:hypothetical protein